MEHTVDESGAVAEWCGGAGRRYGVPGAVAALRHQEGPAQGCAALPLCVRVRWSEGCRCPAKKTRRELTGKSRYLGL